MNTIRKFSDYAREEETKALLLKEEDAKSAYAKKFSDKLAEFGVKSPAELDDDKKAEFFDSLKEEQNTINMIKEELATKVNTVSVQPEPVAAQSASDEKTPLNTVVAEPSGSDGQKTADAIENKEVAEGEPEKKSDDEGFQGDDITGNREAEVSAGANEGTDAEEADEADAEEGAEGDANEADANEADANEADADEADADEADANEAEGDAEGDEASESTISDERKEEIKAAVAAFEALSDEEKAVVVNEEDDDEEDDDDDDETDEGEANESEAIPTVRRIPTFADYFESN